MGGTPVGIACFGVPHPATRALFDYIRALVSSDTGEQPACQLITNDIEAPSSRAQACIYLRSSALDALALLLLDDARTPVTLSKTRAALERIDGAWRGLPTLELEAALDEPFAAIQFLSKHAGLKFDASMLERAQNAFARFSAAASVYDHPARFLRSLETGAIENGSVLECGQPHLTAQGGTGTFLLREGWSTPESWGTWSIGNRSVMSFVAHGAAFTVACACTRIPHDRDVSITVNGEAAPFTIREQSVIEFPLHAQRAMNDEAELFHVEFLVKNPRSPFELGLNQDRRVLGIGLRSVTLDNSEPSAEPPKPTASLVNALRDLGLERARWNLAQQPGLPDISVPQQAA